MNKIVEVIKELSGQVAPQSNGLRYYNCDRIIKYGGDMPLWMVFGERRIGKTHLFTWVAIELYKRYGWQSAFLRNRKVEFEESGFLNSFLNAPLRFGWVDETWVCKPEGVYDGEGNLVILFQALSTYSNARGNEHPDLHFIFMDEVQREDAKVTKRPHIAIMSLCQTFFSGKPDCLCILASNRISATNMMFLGFKIYPDSKYPVTVFKDKGIVIECCRKGDYHKDIEEDNPFNKVYRAGGYGDYADDDEDDMMRLVKPVPKGSRPVYFFNFLMDGIIYSCYHNAPYYYFSENKGKLNPNLQLSSPNLEECVPGVVKTGKMELRKLREMMDANVLRYSTPNVMMAIVSLIYSQDV